MKSVISRGNTSPLKEETEVKKATSRRRVKTQLLAAIMVATLVVCPAVPAAWANTTASRVTQTATSQTEANEAALQIAGSLMRIPEVSTLSVALDMDRSEAVLFGAGAPQAPTSQTAESPATAAALPALDSGINTSAQAEIISKAEIIYALLNYTGATEETYVVNHFSLGSEGSFSDYGTYGSVSNLTNTEPISNSGDEMRLASAEGEFYYQGVLQRSELPWKISLNYTLDGKAVAANEIALLGGKSGRLGIHMATSALPEVDSSFYDHYTLQISLTLPSKNISNLSAPDAIVISAGSNTQVNYTVLPGSDASYDFAVDFDEINMPGISIAAVPFGMSFELPDTSGISEELNTLVNAIYDLYSGTVQLSTGAQAAASGLEQLAAGANQFGGGLAELSTGSNSITTNFSALNTNLDSVIGGLQYLASLGAFDTLDIATKTQLLATIEGLAGISGGYALLDEGLQGYTAGVGSLAASYQSINNGINQSAAGVRQLSNGVSQLSSGAYELSSGVQGMPEEMQSRIDEFAASYDFSGFEPHSYLSSKNSNVVLVQFIFTTPEIELPKEIKEAEKTTEESSILDKITSLFTDE